MVKTVSRVAGCCCAIAVAWATGLSGLATAQEMQLFMAVTGPAGQPILDVRPEEVRVEQAATVCDVHDAVPEIDGMTVALVVDNSGSADGSINSLRDGLRSFLDVLPAEHAVGLFTVAGQVRQREAFTTDRDALVEQVDQLFVERGGSPLVRGVLETWERRFDAGVAWPVFVLVVYEGAESSNFQEREFNELVGELVVRGATVHAVVVAAPNGGLQTNVALNLTGNTGGRHVPIAAHTALPQTLTDLAGAMAAHYEEAGNRYRVVFECDAYDPSTSINAGVDRPGAQVSLFADRRPRQ